MSIEQGDPGRIGLPQPKHENAVQNWRVCLVGDFAFRPRRDLTAALNQRGADVTHSISESNTHIVVGSENAKDTIAKLVNTNKIPILRERAAWAILRGDFDDVSISFASKSNPVRDFSENHVSSSLEKGDGPERPHPTEADKKTPKTDTGDDPSCTGSKKEDDIAKDGKGNSQERIHPIAIASDAGNSIPKVTMHSDDKKEGMSGTREEDGNRKVGGNEHPLRTKLLTTMKTLHDKSGDNYMQFSRSELEMELAETCVEEFMLPNWDQLLKQVIDECIAEGKLFENKFQYSLFPAKLRTESAYTKNPNKANVSKNHAIEKSQAVVYEQSNTPEAHIIPTNSSDAAGERAEPVVKMYTKADKSLPRNAAPSLESDAAIDDVSKTRALSSVDVAPPSHSNPTPAGRTVPRNDCAPMKLASPSNYAEEGIWIGLVRIAKSVSKSGRNECVGCGEPIQKMEMEIKVKDDSLHMMALTLNLSRKKRVEVLHERCMEQAEAKLRARFKDKWKRVLAFPHLDDDDEKTSVDPMDWNCDEPNQALHSPLPVRRRSLGASLRRGASAGKEQVDGDKISVRRSLLNAKGGNSDHSPSGNASSIRRPALRPALKRGPPSGLPAGPKRRAPLSRGNASATKAPSLLSGRRPGVGLQRPPTGASARSGSIKPRLDSPRPRPVSAAQPAGVEGAIDEDEQGDWRGLKRVSEKISKRGMQSCCACTRKIREGEVEMRMREDSMFHMVTYYRKEYTKLPMRGKKDVYMHEDCADEAESICEAQFHRDWKALYRKHLLPQKIDEKK